MTKAILHRFLRHGVIMWHNKLYIIIIS